MRFGKVPASLPVIIQPVSHASILLIWALLAAAPGSAQEPEAPPAYFEEEPTEWSFDWGTDTAFTLSGLEDPSTNATNDRTTNFDALWMRLYGRLERGDQVKLVIDLYSANARSPRIFGLHARVQPLDQLGFRVGLIPLVFGGWQQRAAPSHQPLINQPLFSQYLVPLRNDSVPRSVDELLSQRGRQGRTSYRLGNDNGRVASIAYERCWDTGLELLENVGRFRYPLGVCAAVVQPGCVIVPCDPRDHLAWVKRQ